MQMPVNKSIIVGLFLCLILNCSPSCLAKEDSNSAKETELTVGVVQKEIHAGMSQDEVISALGSPNIVTRDSEGKETWVYDKISKEITASSSNKYGTLILIGASSDREKYSSTQKTLTVIIKFSEKCLVDTFSYHSSKF